MEITINTVVASRHMDFHFVYSHFVYKIKIYLWGSTYSVILANTKCYLCSLIPNIKDNLGRVPDVLTKVALGTVPSVISNMLAVIDGGLGTVPNIKANYSRGYQRLPQFINLAISLNDHLPGTIGRCSSSSKLCYGSVKACSFLM